jgi:hypothetical protein
VTPRRTQEGQIVVAAGGRQAACAAARLLAVHARTIISSAEGLLHEAGDAQALAVATAAAEAVTALIVATHDGDAQVFACQRGSDGH